MMFLSDMTDGTPEILGIRVNDVIMVHLLSDSNKENMTDTSNQKHMATTRRTKWRGRNPAAGRHKSNWTSTP